MPDFWQNKKIAAYIALAHHTRFLSPVMEKLAKLGADIHYIVGQAERSQEITAINLGLPYSHAFDFVTDKDSQDIEDNYRLLRDAFMGNLKSNFLLGMSPVTVTDKTIYATAVEYIGFRNFIQKEKPDLCFALHELNRWGKIFSFWAKKFNVPLLTFQEGLYYGLDFGYTGHMQYSAFNLVWGKRIKDKLVDFEAPEDRILPIGNTHLSKEKKRQEKSGVREKKRKEYKCQDFCSVLLLFSGELPTIEELTPLFSALCKSRKTHLFIKFHPTSKQDLIKKWISLIPQESKPHITTFFENENIYDLMSMSDVCALVQTSTTGLEALFLGKPLICLDVKMTQKMPYSFTDYKVAAQMSPKEFGQALVENIDFSQLIKKKDITRYLANELSETENAIDRVLEISRQVVQASKTPSRKPIRPQSKPSTDWSIILPLSPEPDFLFKQLGAVALNSEGGGTYDVIMIEPPTLPQKSLDILSTMKGDLIRMKMEPGQSLPQIMNCAAEIAKGKNLVFLTKDLLPSPGWLTHLADGIKKHEKKTIFGARILDNRGGILHAGLLLDKNNSPVSAYKHVSADFPHALQERSFLMVDHFVCMNRSFFYELGGFWEKTGSYLFMDLCLRAQTSRKNKSHCIYLSQVCLASLSCVKTNSSSEDAIYFYGKWHGRLWENQSKFYADDKITEAELNTARMAQSISAGNLPG